MLLSSYREMKKDPRGNAKKGRPVSLVDEDRPNLSVSVVDLSRASASTTPPRKYEGIIAQVFPFVKGFNLFAREMLMLKSISESQREFESRKKGMKARLRCKEGPPKNSVVRTVFAA